MIKYKKIGTLSGLGDPLRGINIIKPEFDAQIRAFILGVDEGVFKGVLEEFDYTISGRTITIGSGIAFAKGYCGVCEEGVSYTDTGTGNYAYVYLKFTINRSSEPDLFEVIITDTAQEVVKDDLLKAAGVYMIHLYTFSFISGKITDMSRKFIEQPAKAYHADEAKYLDGSFAADCTAVTQEPGDSSSRIATTEFVVNEITRQIDAKKQSIDILDGTDIIGVINLVRKAKLVIGVGELLEGKWINGNISFTLPLGFIPKYDTYFSIAVTRSGSISANGLSQLYLIRANQQIPELKCAMVLSNSNADTVNQFSFGYEIN